MKEQESKQGKNITGPVERAPKRAEKEPREPYKIPQIAILDFDRMLGDVSASVTRLHEAADSVGIDVSQLDKAQAAVENDGGSFEPLSYIKSQLEPEKYNLFRRNFIFAPGPEIIYPDAQRFLFMLQYADVPHAIMTYGVSAEWQALKMRASGYPMGCTIMDNPDKGAQLQALNTADPATGETNFKMKIAKHGEAQYSASGLTFIDDKAEAFRSMPVSDSYKGYWLQRGNKLLPSQMGEVSQNVHVIRSLDELTVDNSGRIIIGDRQQMSRTSLKPRHETREDFRTIHPLFSQHAIYLPTGIGGMTTERLSDDSFWSVPVIEFKTAA